MVQLLKKTLSKTPERKSATKRIISMLIFMSLFSFIPFVINTVATIYLTYFVTQQDVFIYHEVRPYVTPNDGSEPLAMISETTWFEKGAHVIWNDTLRCEVGGLISEQTTEEYAFEPPRPLGERGSGQWQFNGRLPQNDNVCTMKSVIRWCFNHLSEPVCKTQRINSQPIIFDDGDEVIDTQIIEKVSTTTDEI
jgi:hypothetical protein